MTGFGTWPDGTSDLMYRGAMGYILDGLGVGPVVVDLGGANGLSREFLGEGHQVTTVDHDPTTGPDVTADLMTYRHPAPADTVLLRYVLHYFGSEGIRALFAHLLTWHQGNVVVVQFANDDRQAKMTSSDDRARRAFRTPGEVTELLSTLDGWKLGGRVNRLDYTVQPDFYIARLGVPGVAPHGETLLGLSLEREP